MTFYIILSINNEDDSSVFPILSYPSDLLYKLIKLLGNSSFNTINAKLDLAIFLEFPFTPITLYVSELDYNIHIAKKLIFYI